MALLGMENSNNEGGSGGFSMGSSSDPSMAKSLDEIIADRRKEQQQASKRGPKKASTADRSIATGKAKREAAMKAKRGLTQEKKPSPQDVEREVYRQARKTEVAKKSNEAKATGGRVPPNPASRDNKNKRGGAGGKATGAQTAPPAAFGVKTPSRKAFEAAMRGMESEGIKIPDGHQLVMTFVPVMVAPDKPDPKGKKGAAPGNTNNNKKPAGNNNRPGNNKNSNGPVGNNRPGNNNNSNGPAGNIRPAGNNNNNRRGRGGPK